MKRAWTAFGAAIVAALCMATGARADEPPTVVDASRVTYYLELGDVDAAKGKDLAALLKREFPMAAVELIDGTLRIQTDGTTFAAIEKVLAGQRAPLGGKATLRVELGPDALEALRKRLDHVKARLAAVDEGGEAREELEAVRRRLEEVKERLEAKSHAMKGGRGGKGGKGGPNEPKHERPQVKELTPFAGHHPAPKDHGPLGEFRTRIRHLNQAMEHLKAAGFERLARQAAEGIEQVKRQAEEAAARHRAEEARVEAEKAREREEARARERAQREAGLKGPPTSEELRSEELVDLVRALHQQVNAMREELKALREQVGRTTPR